MFAAMVLAAGLGTRLRPLTERRAKCLVPVGDRPVLAHALDRLEGLAAPVVVNVHHRAPDVRAFARTVRGLAVSEEVELLGTAGGVARARDRLGAGPVLLWNADVLADLDPAALFSAHRDFAPEPAATLVVRSRPDGRGNVGLDPAGRIVRLRGEQAGSESASADFLGIHVIGEGLRATLPERGCLVGDVYIPAIQRGAVLRAFEHPRPFVDVGTIAAYLDANLAWLDARGLDAWAHPGASVAPCVRLARSVVGDGAVVTGQGAVEGCVVWPGARAVAPVRDAVVTPEGVVPRVAS